MERISFVMAVKKHLKLDTESLIDLSAQLKKLTPQDRADLKAAFQAEFGYEVTDST